MVWRACACETYHAVIFIAKLGKCILISNEVFRAPFLTQLSRCLSHYVSHYVSHSLLISHAASHTTSHAASQSLTLPLNLSHYFSISHVDSNTVSHYLSISHVDSNTVSHCRFRNSQ